MEISSEQRHTPLLPKALTKSGSCDMQHVKDPRTRA